MVKKAERTAAELRKGRSVKKARVHHRTRFCPKKPQTQKRAESKSLRALRVKENLHKVLDNFSILKRVLTTEKCMALMDKANTLTYLVDNRANKTMIKDSFKQLFNAKVAKVHTLITPLGKKKAFVKLAPGVVAVELANKMGII
jgi:ribosomal protein L23